MKKIAFLVAATLIGSSAFAKIQTPQPDATPKVLTAQQQKMGTCNKEATGKKGDERKKFMSECLKKKPEATTATVAPTTTAPVTPPAIVSAPKK